VSRPVFFLDSAAEVSAGASCVLGGPEGHHASVVRRVRPGEELVLTDGRGTALDVEVIRVGRGEVTCRVEAVQHTDRAALQVTVVQAIPKGERGELAVDLLTEVGVDEIVPWQAERCISRWTGEKVTRGRAKWEAAAREAAKQSRRTWWPVVAPVADLDAVVGVVSSADVACVLHEGAAEPLSALLGGGALPRGGHVVLVVGPEGGLSQGELTTITSAGGTAVRLGPTVLRTSTAGVVAASLVLAETAAWGRTLGGLGYHPGGSGND
jgi:16S rRNA (uracil1498-N3)-methyltransferase